MTPNTVIHEAGEFPEELIGVAQAVEVEFAPVALSFVFERHPSSGHAIPERFLMIVPPQIAKPMLERLAEQLQAEDRPEWLTSH